MKKYILFILLCLTCSSFADEPKEVLQNGWGGMRVYTQTIEHDAHKFILFITGNSQGGVSVVHHPDCPCQKKETIE
jgi:hypothetical protein